MFTIHVDGQMIYSSALYDAPDKVLAPHLSLETTNAGSFSFVLSPNHPAQGLIRRKKSIITVEQDGALLFRGRAADTELDVYNQFSVYCEGDKAFLNDSVFPASVLSGKVLDFFNALIANHNSQVEPEKQFTVGVVDVVSANEELVSAARHETRVYWNTAEMIETSLLKVYGGYLRTRTEGGTTYLDWVKEYGKTSEQAIEFGVNLLDLTNRADAGDVFTVLVPMGYSEINSDGSKSDPVTIESVNNGLDYIQNDEAVALYGKIWRTYTWQYEKDPAELLVKARNYLAKGTELETLTIKAVDMHFVDGNAQAIHMGDMVRIHSEPHGLNRTIICAKIDMDLFNPENTVYTFGEPPRMLTDDINDLEEESKRRGGGGGGGKSLEEELSDIIRWAQINVSETNAQILLTAGELDKVTERVSAAEIALDGVNATIALKASKEEVTDLGKRVSSAEVAIDGANAAIELKVNKDGVISSINQTAESITIQASKINLSGYVTTSKLSAELASITSQISTSITTSSLSAASVRCTNLYVGGARADFTTVKYTDADGNAKTIVVLAQ